MCALLRACFEAVKEAFLNDLRPKYILPRLIKDEILTEEEQKSILKNEDTTHQVKQLFDILGSKGSQCTFDSLVNALKQDHCYPWLAEKLVVQEKNVQANQLEHDDSEYVDKQLAAGGVPFQANNLLHRTAVLNDIRSKLRSASGRKWVALHGMVGSGKSVVAADAVRDYQLLRDCFEHGIFWIAIGKIQNSSNLLFRMQTFQDMLKLPPPAHCQNELTLNLTLKIHTLTRYLKETVSKKKKMLVVLDDVWDDCVIEAFDVGCPVFVTTRDKGVLEHHSSYTDFIHIPELDLKESKELLSLYLQTDPTLLPPEVETIHNRFRGSPMVLSLVGGWMAPFGNNEGRWKYLAKKLQKEGHINTLTLRQRHPSSDESHQKSLKEVIKLSVGSLDSTTRKYYSDFALFQEDLYIPNEVFETHWGLEKYDVEDILHKAVEKSLLQVKESPSRSTRIYSIHDLYLEFLKDQCDDIVGLQKKMICQYRELCKVSGNQVKKYDYGLLPHDGYIHYFIGHHLRQAEEHDLFAEIFFDLGFVKHKICVAGPNDLLNDYSLYKDNFENHLDEMCDFMNFIRRNVSSITEDTDIIQLALLEPFTSKVHERAKREMSLNSTKFYLEICNQQNMPDYDELHIISHQDEVKCAVFCPDNRFIVSAGGDAILKVSCSSSGRGLHSLIGHTEAVNCCAFNSAGDTLISASADKTVKAWSINIDIWVRYLSEERRRYSHGDIHAADSDCKCLHTFREHKGEVLWCAFSSDDQLIISGDSTGVAFVWNSTSGIVKHRLEVLSASSAIHCCAFNNDSSKAVTSSDGLIKLWNLSDRSVLDLKHEDEFVSQFCFTKDGKIIFSIAGDSVWKWDLAELDPSPNKIQMEGISLCSCCLSPDEQYLALGTSPDNSIVIMDVRSKKIMTSLKKHKCDVYCVSYSIDGSKLLSASSDQNVIIWNNMTERLVNPVVPLENNLTVNFSNGLTAATSDHLRHIQVFSGDKGVLKKKSPPDEDMITACSLSNDCSEVVYGTKYGSVKIFDVNSGNVLQCLPSHNAQVINITHMKSCSSFITCSQDDTLRIWENSRKFAPLEGHDQVVMYVLYACDTKMFSCSNNGTSVVWDLRERRKLLEFNCHGNLRINFCDVSPDESILATASTDCTVKLWRENDGCLLRTFQCQNYVRCCQFSPKSNVLVSGEDSGNVTIWNVNGSLIKSAGKHESWVREIKFSEDGRYFVSVADSIKIWDQTGNLVQKLVLPGDLEYSLRACQNFTTFVVLHNSVLYILKSVF